MKVFRKLDELPTLYKYIYRTGDISKNKEILYYYPRTAFVLLLVLAIMPVLPLIYIFLMLFSEIFWYLYLDFGTFWEKFMRAPIISLILFIVTGAMIAMVLYGCFWVLMMLWRSWQIIHDRVKNKLHFGLLLSDEYLVWRKKDMFAPVIFIPKKYIIKIYPYDNGNGKAKSIGDEYRLEYYDESADKRFYIKIGIYEFQTERIDHDINRWLDTPPVAEMREP